MLYGGIGNSNPEMMDTCTHCGNEIYERQDYIAYRGVEYCSLDCCREDNPDVDYNELIEDVEWREMITAEQRREDMILHEAGL